MFIFQTSLSILYIFNIVVYFQTIIFFSRNSSIMTFFFCKEVQVLKVFVLGEEERGQSQYQVMCFITHIPNDDFISSDAISKLRQVR